jgi:hypothetical protein
MMGLVGRHAVAISQLPMNVDVKVRERGPESFVELPRAVLVRRAAPLRRVIEEVVGEEFLEHCKVSPALHFFGVAPNDCLCGFTRLMARHHVPSSECRSRVATDYAPAPAF